MPNIHDEFLGSACSLLFGLDEGLPKKSPKPGLREIGVVERNYFYNKVIMVMLIWPEPVRFAGPLIHAPTAGLFHQNIPLLQ